jgi:hypothetical protein
VASITGWPKIPFYRIEDNLGSLLIPSSLNSVLLMVSLRFILREENCIPWRNKTLDGLCHFPKDGCGSKLLDAAVNKCGYNIACWNFCV